VSGSLHLSVEAASWVCLAAKLCLSGTVGRGRTPIRTLRTPCAVWQAHSAAASRPCRATRRRVPRDAIP